MTDFDPTKPVRQRNGREARILATDCRQPGLPIVAEILGPHGKWGIQMFQRDGSAPFSTEDSLVNIPERVSWFVPGKRRMGVILYSKEDARVIELIFEGDEFIEAKYHRS